ncbi:hypothetical protein Zmor_022784 [Zophobas morio]|uniref:Uncharacterized protein n=1 Tax=Zophobas morio TaxID=2755281 RepID=A0AA38HUU5_9CUCU|nr:hypothetical protein Zmor_022117 [Zophobas morio]KAJ3645097.1 hypothetical protein Zmor_022784 [Zophobas morio]
MYETAKFPDSIRLLGDVIEWDPARVPDIVTPGTRILAQRTPPNARTSQRTVHFDQGGRVGPSFNKLNRRLSPFFRRRSGAASGDAPVRLRALMTV